MNMKEEEEEEEDDEEEAAPFFLGMSQDSFFHIPGPQ